MRIPDLLIEAYGRIGERVHAVLADLDPDALAVRPAGPDGGPSGNSIGWLVWHLTRVQDDHLAELMGRPQVWHEQGWFSRFGLPFGQAATGYGQSSQEVDALGGAGVTAELLRGYFDAVHERSVEHLGGLTGDDLDRVVDQRWDPPVTLGVRLISVLDDDLEHLGQAAYVRGLLGH